MNIHKRDQENEYGIWDRVTDQEKDKRKASAQNAEETSTHHTYDQRL